MQSTDSQVLESYVPVYDVIPEKWEDARPFVVEQLRKISNAVNIREIGWFLDEELLSGKAFIPGTNNAMDGGTSQQYRQVLRKVINFGALPNAGTKSVAHNIVFDTNFTLVFLGAYATNPTNLQAIPIPFASPTLNQNILIYIDSNNVNITTVLNYSIYTRCFVILEYMQEL